jgi:two-component system chemotaxis response regulator CheB
MPIRVLIVDDSRIIRGVLTTALRRFPDIEVIGEAGDGQRAAQLVKELGPDVVTLDVLMPLMGGIEAIEAIMRERPTPIVVVADLERADSSVAMDAIARGAIDIFPKPQKGFDATAAQTLAAILRMSASVPLSRAPAVTAARQAMRQAERSISRRAVRMVGMVASTGGPRALQAILRALPRPLPCPVAIVQHTAAGSTEALADWLRHSSGHEVSVAYAGQRLRPGQVVVAPEDVHLQIDIGYAVTLPAGPRVDGHRPSGTLLLKSLAANFSAQAVGVVLSGMGSDGAEGIAAVEAAGGLALIEDPASSVISGMPNAARARTRSALVLPTDALADALRRLLFKEKEPRDLQEDP